MHNLLFLQISKYDKCGFIRTIATYEQRADENFNLNAMAIVRSEVNCCNWCPIVS